MTRRGGGTRSGIGGGGGGGGDADAPMAKGALKGMGPGGVYVPFGAGPRVCIGTGFAMMESALLLAMVARAVDVSDCPGRIRRGRGRSSPTTGERSPGRRPEATMVVSGGESEESGRCLTRINKIGN